MTRFWARNDGHNKTFELHEMKNLAIENRNVYYKYKGSEGTRTTEPFTNCTNEAKWRPKITMLGNEIPFNSAPKFLGVHLDRSLSFQEHVKQTKETGHISNKALNLIRFTTGQYSSSPDSCFSAPGPVITATVTRPAVFELDGPRNSSNKSKSEMANRIKDRYDSCIQAYTDGSCTAGMEDGGAAAVMTRGSARNPQVIKTIKKRGKK